MAGQLQSMWSLLREFNLGQIRTDLERPFRLVVVGFPHADRDEVASLMGAGLGPAIVTIDLPLDASSRLSVEAADLVLLVAPESPSARQGALEAISVISGAKSVAVLNTSRGGIRALRDKRRYGPSVDEVINLDLDRKSEAQKQIFDAVLRLDNSEALGLGRHAPELREPVADRLIRAASLANAEFAALSSLPGWIPVLGSLGGDGADLIMLTKNEVLLVYKLAGLYGRDLRHPIRLFGEIAPVVAGAFFWRTLARSLVGLLPGPLAIAPKTAVAYSGTVAVGEVARRYFRDGVRLSPASVQELQRQTLARIRRSTSDAA